MPLTLPSDPLDGLDTILYVKLLPSTSVADKVIVFAVSSLVDALTAAATGTSFTAVTVTVIVDVLLSNVPSLALYVMVSVPFQSWLAVYVKVAPLIEVDPFDASLTTEYVKSSPSTSLPSKLIPIIRAVRFSSIETLKSFVIGASFTESTMIVTVPALLSTVPSLNL